MSHRDRALRVTPGGSQTRSKRDLLTELAESGHGSHLHTMERAYVDWVAGLASVGLGYQHEEVDEAVIRQIRDHGVSFSVPSRLEVEVAEALIEALGWPEMVRWVKTGSEATEGAMMIARSYTGRRTILSVGYHGWHIAHQADMYTGVMDVPWGDADALEKKFKAGYVAAVLLEPMRDHEPPRGYLQDVQVLCRLHGALLILDEMVTGFRWALGGASDYYGIVPDLSCFGKAMSNGYALAAIVGPRRIMADHCDGISSTFGGEGVGLAACRATLRVYQTEPVIEHLWAIGRSLMGASPIPMEGFAVHPRFTTDAVWPKRDPVIVELCQRAARKGVLIHPAGLNPMYAHTKQDVATTVEALA